jgi:hypothetical protein
VALVAGAVIATLLTLVAVATPSVGVTSVGLVANTKEPDPVSSVTAAARLADDGVPKKVRIPAAVDVVLGATPAPPPITIALAANAPELAQVVPLEKYGIPPDVPAIVNAGVVVAVATETIPPVQLTLVTVPDPPPPDAAIVMPPEELVTVMPEPAVNVARLNPDPLPISN